MSQGNDGPQVGPGGVLRAWLQLVRLPNLFTAMADVTMGFLFVRMYAAGDARLLGLLLSASVALYAAGCVLNDVFDYAEDLCDRPGRPLPSGRVSRAAARAAGFALLAAGVGLAWAAAATDHSLRPGVVGSLLGLCILAYDAGLKRTPLGPVAMGGCRALNVLLGMSVIDGSLGPTHWAIEHAVVVAALGIYVAGLTWFARTEAVRSNRGHLVAGMLLMMAGAALLASLPQWTDALLVLSRIPASLWYVFMGAMVVLVAVRCLWAVLSPSPYVVQMAVKQSILSLVMLDAAACFTMKGSLGALMVLMYLIPATLLGQYVRST